MENTSIVNKQSIKKNKALRVVQKKARKYYQEKLFMKAPNTITAKIRKLADLEQVDYKVISNIDLPQQKNEVQLSKEELITLCRKGELTGRSGNGFEVSKKLAAFHKNHGVLIINAVECDPGLVTDSWLYRNKQNALQKGARILKNALALDKVMLATKEPLIPTDTIQQVKVIDRFPMGYEKYLIRYLLGITLNDDELPQDKGILVMNLQTVIAIAEMAQNSMAGQYKYITVANLFTATAKVARVRIGDSVHEILNGCFPQEAWDVVTCYAGGGAFNCHKAAADEVIQTTTGYVAIGKMPDYERAGNCKGCGACTRNCPAGVIVNKVIQQFDKNGRKLTDKCKELNVAACIGCGACTYNCMAGKDVRSVMLYLKGKINDANNKGKNNI